MVFTKEVGEQFESLSDAFISFVDNIGKHKKLSPVHLWQQVWKESQRVPN